jgi:hypothetical protein
LLFLTHDLLFPTCTGYAGQQKSAIIAMGLTIHNAPVELREKLAVPEAEWPRAIEELCSYPHIEEAAILSTCNRMELYIVAVSWHRGVREVIGSKGLGRATSSLLQPGQYSSALPQRLFTIAECLPSGKVRIR